MELPAWELRYWLAFERIEPIGCDRSDYHAGQLSATIANVNRQNSSPVKTPGDFVPWWNDAQSAKDLDPDAQMTAFFERTKSRNL